MTNEIALGGRGERRVNGAEGLLRLGTSWRVGAGRVPTTGRGATTARGTLVAPVRTRGQVAISVDSSGSARGRAVTAQSTVGGGGVGGRHQGVGTGRVRVTRAL